MASPLSSNIAAAAMQADIGDARRARITQAPDSLDRFHDQHEEAALQARRNPNPRDRPVLNAWNSFHDNDPTPDLEACAMPSITHGGVTHRLNRLAVGDLTPRIASPLPTGDTVRGRGRVRGSRGIGTDAGIPRTRRDAQNTHISGQSHYAANQFNYSYMPRIGLLTSESASTVPNPRAEPSSRCPRRRRRHRGASSAGSGGQEVHASTPSAIPSTARALHPAGELASPEEFMAAVRTSRGLGVAPSDPGHAEPAADGTQRRPALYPGVAERPLLSPSTVERGSALLHAEDPTESTAILSGSDTSGNGNAGGNCDTRGNGTGNGSGDNTGNDDNASSGDRNGTDDSGRQFSSDHLNTILGMIETFTSALKTRSQQPLETLLGRRHHTEALRVEALRVETRREEAHREDTHREDVPSDETRTEPHEEAPHRGGLLDSKWAPRN